MGFPTYINPVHNRPCPDPFVMKHLGEYWCYATGFWRDGRAFGVMHSRDLVNWRELAGAMEPLSESYNCYWAPEVTYYNGRFFMYYSVGNEERMQIRVAVADHPAGPFADSGHRLTREDFAIDPHVFEDGDGSRYLFYATDFLTHTYIGTGTVLDRMIDPFRLAGEARPVTRARYDWQVYDPNRAEKGGVRWHTVEGPFVLKHKGRYYEMFSGGNWKNVTYGVSYAVTDDINTREEWAQASDGTTVLPILRTLPGEVIGPGHNSAVRGPDNRQLFCVYHRWAEDGSDRVLAIDRQDWVGRRMVILGASTTPQPAPIRPALDGFSGEWNRRGAWAFEEGALVQQDVRLAATATLATAAPYYLLELSLRSLTGASEGGFFGLGLSGGGQALRFALAPGGKEAVISSAQENSAEQRFALPHEFDVSAFHLLRVQVSGRDVSFTLDGLQVGRSRMHAPPDELELFTDKVAAAFAGLALTYGWEDLFTDHEIDPADVEWRAEQSGGDWRISDQELRISSGEGQRSVITKGPLLESYELVVNARLDKAAGANACYGFYPAIDERMSGPLFTIERGADGWSMVAQAESARSAFALPHGFDPHVYQQFRFRKSHGRLSFQFEAEALGEIEMSGGPCRVGLFARAVTAAFDMVRVTEITGSM